MSDPTPMSDAEQANLVGVGYLTDRDGRLLRWYEVLSEADRNLRRINYGITS